MTIPLYTASWSVMANRWIEGDQSIVPVRTSVGLPRFWPDGASFAYVAELAPVGLRHLALADFEPAYVRRLEQFGVELIAPRLEAIYDEYARRPLALVCFEAERSACHRNLAALWLEQHGLGPVRELVPPGVGKTHRAPAIGWEEAARFEAEVDRARPASGKAEPAQNSHILGSGHVRPPHAPAALTEESP